MSERKISHSLWKMLVSLSCQVCAELKPRFCKPPQNTLIKATQTFERLAIDFEGPLPSSTRNIYILVPCKP